MLPVSSRNNRAHLAVFTVSPWRVPASAVEAARALAYRAIPGWQVAGGLPAVVRYGTPGFPKTAKSWPANRGNLFAGGAGGTAKLGQQTSVTPNARYDIAGWLIAAGDEFLKTELTAIMNSPAWTRPGPPVTG